MEPATSSPLVDLKRLAARPLTDEPYRWGYLRDAIERDHASLLRSTFPTDGFWQLRKHDGEKYMQFRIRPLVPLGVGRVIMAESLHPAWLRFIEELLSPAYRHAFAQALGQSLDDALLEISAWRWGPDAQLGPHVDIPRKLASQVFYFNESWDARWGGCLRILGSSDIDDVVAELPPALGSASVIVRSSSSWHAVPRVHAEATGERLSVIATWQHPGTESPYFTVSADDAVHCHVAASVRDAP